MATLIMKTAFWKLIRGSTGSAGSAGNGAANVRRGPPPTRAGGQDDGNKLPQIKKNAKTALKNMKIRWFVVVGGPGMSGADVTQGAGSGNSCEGLPTMRAQRDEKLTGKSSVSF